MLRRIKSGRFPRLLANTIMLESATALRKGDSAEGAGLCGESGRPMEDGANIRDTMR